MDAAIERLAHALSEFGTDANAFEATYDEQLLYRVDMKRELTLYSNAVVEHTREVIADEAMLKDIMDRAGARAEKVVPKTPSYSAPVPMFGRANSTPTATPTKTLPLKSPKAGPRAPTKITPRHTVRYDVDASLDSAAEEDLLAWQMAELSSKNEHDENEICQRHR